MKRKPKTPEPPKFSDVPLVIETFREPSYDLDKLVRYNGAPSCFNGQVSIRKYRVTAELIEESDDVLRERVRKLWRECENCHHYSLLSGVAALLGIALDPKELGKDVKTPPAR